MRALNSNQVTVGNGLVICPCTATASTSKRKGTSHNLLATHATSLVQGKKSPSKLLPFILMEKRFMLCHVNPPAYVFVCVWELLLTLRPHRGVLQLQTRRSKGMAGDAVGYHMTNFLMALVINVLIASIASWNPAPSATVTDPFAAVNHSNRCPVAWSISTHVYHLLGSFNFSFHVNRRTQSHSSLPWDFPFCVFLRQYSLNWGTEGISIALTCQNRWNISSPSVPYFLVLGRHLHA